MDQILQPGLSVISRAIKRISAPVKAALTASFLAGLIVYGFAMTNIVLCTGDALNNTVFNGNLIWIGRWSSHWLSALSTDYAIPAVSTFLMICAVALLAGVSASLLKLKSKLSGALCGVVLMCHPAVGNTLVYLHNADAYMIASLLGVAALWLTDRKKGLLWMFLSVALLAVGTGTYQSVLSLVAALMFVRAVQRILNGMDDNRTLALAAVRYIVVFAAAVVVYYVMVKVSTAVSGLVLTDYQSASAMGQFTAQELFRNFLGCFGDFRQSLMFLSFRPGFYVNGYPNYLFAMAAICLIPVCYLFSQNKNWLKTIVILFLTALSPVLLCSIRLANPGVVQPRMTYSMAGLYLLGLVLMQFMTENWNRLPKARIIRFGLSAGSWLLTVCLAIAVFVWSVGINLDLYKGKKEYDHLYSRCADYLQRAECVEGYEPGMPVYVIGAAENSARPSPALSEPMYYYAFMVHYMDAAMPFGIAGDINAAAEQLQQNDAFRAMPCWPAEECAALIENAVVVKLSN